MELKHLAIRELVKESEEAPARITGRGGIIPTSEPIANQLFETLNSAFSRRSSLTHGSFNHENEEGYPFISAFEQFVASEWDEAGFAELTDKSMAQLAAAINNPSAHTAHGGYVLFALYASDRYEYLLIALVRDKASIGFDNDLHPTEVMEVNLDQLHQGARINITTFRKKQDSYLSFIGSKEKGEITHYFSTAFGCTDVTPSRKSTGELIRAARDFCNQNNMSDRKEEVVEDVVSYLEKQRSEKESANLNDVQNLFDAYIPPEQAETVAGTFGTFANQGPYNVSQEFQPHTSTINRFAKLKVKADNWGLDFNKRSLGDLNSGKDIEFDEDGGRLIIKRLPSKVLNQLREALEQQD
ncbi:nucleoid-associated protein [Neptuniibacter halophilus]|uniref:nucleoid-associated protein n=1 Tax=Neptuniibacter halophilus TaxID=651666 RepID=UPI002572917A|nr:nucleoid-associated protein [Neptuniibacter halophilus]